MMKKMLTVFVLGLLATVILLPSTACRRMKVANETGIPAIENAGNLDVLL